MVKMENQRAVLTFDVGGSHVAAAVCREDLRLGRVASAPHPDQQSAAAFVDLLTRLGREAEAGDLPGQTVEGAMLAVPGPFDLEAGISRMEHKLPYLYGFNLREALAARLGFEPRQIRFLNDADAYLLGEIGAGAAAGFNRVIGLTLGTGIGSAFAVDGRIVTEGEGVPPGGEIWNLPYNGATGNGATVEGAKDDSVAIGGTTVEKTVEDFVSTRAIVSAYLRRTGQTRAVVEIARAAVAADHSMDAPANDPLSHAANDAAAREAFAEFGSHLGRVIGTVLDKFHADAIVLGGGIAQSAELFLDAARNEIPPPRPALRVAQLGERAPLAGCAQAWFQPAKP